MTSVRTEELYGVRPRTGELADRVLGGMLLQGVPPRLVDEAIAEAGAGELRRRRMPARLAAYFTLALWLWRADNYATVIAKLADALRWAGNDTPATAASSASRARDRLGPDPMRILFRRLTEPAWGDAASRTGWRGLAVRYLESTLVETPERCGFTQARILALADAAGGLIDATWAPPSVSLGDLVDRLLRSCRWATTTGTLVVTGTVGHAVWTQLTGTGAHLITEAPRTAVGTTSAMPPWPRVDSSLERLRRRPARIIPGPGAGPGGGLATTLTDPAEAPAQELAHLHASRWEADDVGRRICGRIPARLRSQSGLGADQEIWALLCLYQALHRTLPRRRYVEPDKARHRSLAEHDRFALSLPRSCPVAVCGVVWSGGFMTSHCPCVTYRYVR